MVRIVCYDFPHLALNCCPRCHEDDDLEYNELVNYDPPTGVEDSIALVCCGVSEELDELDEDKLVVVFRYARRRALTRGKKKRRDNARGRRVTRC